MALDGAYNEDQTIYHHESPSNDTASNSEPKFRHRHTTSTNSSASVNDVNNEANDSPNPEPAESQGLHMVLWNATTKLFKFPFIIMITTLNTFYDFFATLIRPALSIFC